MNRKLILSLALASIAFLAPLAFAQTVATDPVGFTTLTVNAKPASIRGFTLLSLNMTRLQVFQGLIPAGGVSAGGSPTVLTFPASTFTPSAFNGNHYIEVVNNGANTGLLSDIVSNSDSQITLADDISASVTAGTSSIKIRPMWTLGTAFGVNNSAGFQGAATVGNADVISIINPATGTAANYFYNTTANQWKLGGADATNAVIPPDAGLRIERRPGTSQSFQLVGAVKLGPTGLFVQGGSVPENVNFVPNPYPLASVTLAASNLFTGNNATGVRGGSTIGNADVVGLFNTATGAYTNYFYNTTAGQWRQGGSDASNVTIPDGAAIVIRRKSSTPGQFGSFIWYMPQPPMNLN